MKDKIKISVNTEIINKSNQQKSDRFIATEMTNDELVESITTGYAHSNIFIDDKRQNENFSLSQVVQLDFDGTISLEDMQNNSFVRDNGAFIYTTPSHGVKEGDRFRVVFVLEEPISDKQRYEYLMRGFLKRFPQADPQCKDPARFFFGNNKAEITIIDLSQRVSRTLVEILIELGDVASSPTKVESKFKIAKNYKRLSMEDAKEMLGSIGIMPGYEIWRNITWALCSEFDREIAYQLIQDWSPDYKHNGETTRSLIEKYDGRSIGLGTLIYHAIKNGYRFPKSLANDQRTEGQVALQDVFNNGVGVITSTGTLYEYREGYYQELPNHEAEERITSYFDIYETSQGKNGYATKSRISAALDFVKMATAIKPGQEINPPGLNVNNGFIEITYDENDNPLYRLREHSVNRICLHKAMVDYDPDIDSSIFDRALDDIISGESQEVLLRSIAASLDLNKVRSKHGRAVKALLLIGDGNNGKDTLRVWTSTLFDNGGMTYIPLQAFKSADNDRLNGIYQLKSSRINWPAENVSISLDRCETLKKVITGDPTPIEKKYHDRFDIEPKTVCLFNCNKLPFMEASQEAIISRYNAIEFGSCFKSNPDPNNQKEKQADSRLKDDRSYINRHITPAFLNRILKAFKGLMESGIQHQKNNELMERIKEHSNHLIEFINAHSLFVSKDGKYMASDELWAFYRNWCEDKGYVELTDELGIYAAHNPSDYDKICRNAGLLAKALQKVLPGMEPRRSSDGARGWNLDIKVTV